MYNFANLDEMLKEAKYRFVEKIKFNPNINGDAFNDIIKNNNNITLYDKNYKKQENSSNYRNITDAFSKVVGEIENRIKELENPTIEFQIYYDKLIVISAFRLLTFEEKKELAIKDKRNSLKDIENIKEDIPGEMGGVEHWKYTEDQGPEVKKEFADINPEEVTKAYQYPDIQLLYSVNNNIVTLRSVHVTEFYTKNEDLEFLEVEEGRQKTQFGWK